ncbi:Na+/Pi symporter [Trebouxia sp. C0009 RCD-2024]
MDYQSAQVVLAVGGINAFLYSVCLAASVMGAIFVFPGVRQLKVGGTNSEPPYLTGIGAVFIGLMLAPILTICGAVLTYLGTRKTILRSEDPFHKALWNMPMHACSSAVTAGLAVIYAVQSPRGTTWFHTTPQGSCIILAAVGSAMCILYTVLIPRMTRRMRNKLPSSVAIKRMNLLGLDEATVRELAADDASQDVKGWLQRAHTYLFQPDVFASVSSNDTLMRIHSTAEEHDKAAEELFAPLQKGLAIVLSLVYGSFNGATSYGVFALMRDIAATNQVANTSSLGMELRCASAVGLTLGSLLFGARIVPVTGKLASLPRVLPHPCYVLAGSLGYPCAFH